MPNRSAIAAALLVLGSACNQAEETARAVSDKTKAAVEAAEQAQKTAEEVADKTKDAVAAAEQAGAKAKEVYDDIPGTGHLSDTAKSWVGDGDGIEGWIAKGVQVAPTALEIGKTVNAAVDRETVIEPIFMEVGDDSAQKKLDKDIDDMPRVEVIDDVKVGFKSLDKLDSGSHVKERGYLVMWRQGNHMIGFVYRTKREVDIEKLVEEAPRLIKLTRKALD